jgi:VIT1/CCC1 family predicted Fe2+/Mn2+ transporter
MRLFGRVLAPVERLSEILFGLIMALTVTSAVSVATADHMRSAPCERISQMPPSRAHPGLAARDWQGAFGVFALVVAATFPVVVPFAVIDDARLALRISNVLAVTSLFLCGYLFGQHAGLPPWLTGLVMVVIGAALVSIAIALGG